MVRLASGEITLFMAVPTIYHRLIAAWDSASAERQRQWSEGARRLRLMVSGSAALPVRILERWRVITGHTLLERYGMTEIGMALSNPLSGERRAGTVGQPLPGVDLAWWTSRDAWRRPVPRVRSRCGVAQVFLEYWQRPEATRAAFRDGWFRTGDEAVLQDGYYRILGRSSMDIIKCAGHKLSALEIEDALREHPAVRDCAVVGLPDDDLGERVAVAVVTNNDVNARTDAATDVPVLETEAFLAWARARLAPYKVPRAVRVVDDLPRNAMGKVTKEAVKRLFREAPDGSAS